MPPFLTAEWRHLILMNWEVDSRLLREHAPRGTELDTWNGSHYVSLVGFRFLNTRVLGVPIPFHRHFEEVNLRFYVRRRVGNEVRRGVCFLRELVPRHAIALVARMAYNEPYRATAMAHHVQPRGARFPSYVEYSWREGESSNRLRVHATDDPVADSPHSHERFITEHYWGYTRQRDGGTIEYQVQHPQWAVRIPGQARVDGDLSATYGRAFAAIMAKPPASVLLADGSPVTVHLPTRVEP